jgi:hypothetical protein
MWRRRWVVIGLGFFGCAAPTEDEPAGVPVAPPALTEPRYDFHCPNASVLACTGLYGPEGQHWASKRLGSGVFAYAPGAELWSDGMHKARFVWLPPGTTIDAAQSGEWKFPNGTKFWKEFTWRGKRIETRYLENRFGYWYRTTYRWNASESNAFELRAGEVDVPGTEHYEIPTASDCDRCHGGARNGILGFDAILLSDPRATGLNATELTARALLTPPLPPIAVPGTDAERDALTYLHVNCGVSCHNPTYPAEAWWTGFYLRLEPDQLGSVQQTNTYLTGVGVDSYIAAPDNPYLALKLIAPGEPARSAVIVRDSARGSYLQMPPLATHVVNDAGLALLERWIGGLK